MGRVFTILYDDRFNELGAGLIYSNILRIYLIFVLLSTGSFMQGQEPVSPKIKSSKVEYYKYWNPYRRVLDLRGEPQSFYGQV